LTKKAESGKNGENVSNKIHAEKLLTSHEVGELLQVNPSSVKKWVDDGVILAFRTPGGHRRIRASDLMSFLEHYKMPIPEPLVGSARRRVLIVDDDPAQLRALERRMKPFRDRVELVTSENGIDAMVLVGATRPHLIVLDVFMPDLDGLEVCRRFKLNPETRDVRIVVTSGHMTDAVAGEAMEAGALRCMSKPIDLKVLLELLDGDGAEEQLAGRG